ncbi:hypothetical protein Tco_0875929 [Tanacetum coccineum]|uniref:Integrase, catalytic region, zinc finger, CCHC-type, peptidase aspartic, catalytic n=1 Tax=Tanacetum coccineum TaxID=301880 RepID=A0ABQ5BUB8_9ASTR
MNVINMSMRAVQVNTNFLNSLPPEWSKFVMNVKLARDLHTTNYDQLYSYLEQHEVHANETRLMRDATRSLAFCEGHMARQCTQPKRPRNAAWFKEKAMLAEAHEDGQILDEEQLAILADPCIPHGQAAQTIIPNIVAF